MSRCYFCNSCIEPAWLRDKGWAQILNVTWKWGLILKYHLGVLHCSINLHLAVWHSLYNSFQKKFDLGASFANKMDSRGRGEFGRGGREQNIKQKKSQEIRLCCAAPSISNYFEDSEGFFFSSLSLTKMTRKCFPQCFFSVSDNAASVQADRTSHWKRELSVSVLEPKTGLNVLRFLSYTQTNPPTTTPSSGLLLGVFFPPPSLLNSAWVERGHGCFPAAWRLWYIAVCSGDIARAHVCFVLFRRPLAFKESSLSASHSQNTNAPGQNK